jgi:hypothetical protein
MISRSVMRDCRMVFACAAPLMLLLLGCEGPSYDGTRLQPHASDGEDEDTASDAVTNSSSSGGKPTTPKGPCAGESSASTCLDCCAERSPDAVESYAATFRTCLCDSPGTCAAECGSSYCSGTKPNAACATCLKSAGKCDDTALSACEKDSTCAPLLKCSTESKCSSKPL